jgi:hypothetical protein
VGSLCALTSQVKGAEGVPSTVGLGRHPGAEGQRRPPWPNPRPTTCGKRGIGRGSAVDQLRGCHAH